MNGVVVESRSRWGQVGRWALGLGVAGLSIWLLARDLDWRVLGSVLGSAEYRWVFVGVLAIIATFFTRAWRWQVLLRQSPLPLRPTMTALLVGQVVNLALPMRSGDVLRAVWISRGGRISVAAALGSIVVEKIWDLLALLACGLVLLAWMPLPQWFRSSTWGTALGLGIGLGLLWAGLHWQEAFFHGAGWLLARFPAGWDRAILPRLRRLSHGLDAIRQPGVSLRALFWTGLTWGFGALANLAVLATFGIAPFTSAVVAAVFLLAALMVGGAVPTPGRLGVFEGITVVSLALFSVPRDQALAVGLVLHLVVMGPALLAAALLAFWPDRRIRRADG